MKIGGYRSSGSDGPKDKCPAGEYPAVLVGISDIGYQPSPFKNEDGSEQIKRQLILTWEVDKRDTKGRRFHLLEYVTASSNPKSGMAARWKAMMGRAPTDAECDAGFEDTAMLGRCVYLYVEDPKKEGGFPRISQIVPLPKAVPPITAETMLDPNDPPPYVRKAREKAVEKPTYKAKEKAPAADGSDVPF